MIVFAAIGTQIALWFLDNEDPYVYDQEQSYVLPNPTGDGSRITASWKLKEVRRVCPATSMRMLRDAAARDFDKDGKRIPYSGDVVATYDATPAALSIKITDERLIRTFVLPRGLPPSVDYSSKLCFECNPIQHIWPHCMLTPELTFDVVPSNVSTPEVVGKEN